MTPEEEEKERRKKVKDWVAGTQAAGIAKQPETVNNPAGLYNPVTGGDAQYSKDPLAPEIAAMRQQERAYGNVANSYAGMLQEAEQRNAEATKAEDTRNIFGATTEFLTNLVNLAGVTKGASNAQLPLQSQTWMQDVDRKRRERRREISDIQERHIKARQQAETIRANNGLQLAEMRRKYAQQQYENELAAEKLRQSLAQQQFDNNLELAKLQADTALKREQLEQRKRTSNDTLAVNMTAKGLKYDANGNPVVDPNSPVWAKKAGSGSSQLIQVALPGADGGAGEVIAIKPGSLERTVQANIHSITDLSEEDKKVLSLLDGNDIRELMPYLVKSEQLRKLVREAAASDAQAAQQAAPAAPMQEDIDDNDLTGGLDSFFD